MMNSEAWRLIDYITFKLDCAREQEALRWKLDVPKAEDYLKKWEALKSSKVEQLADAMPEKVTKKMVQAPAEDKYYKKNGEISVAGEKWVTLCKQYRQPLTAKSFMIDLRERANPNSPDQVKAWLNKEGWMPRTFKFTRDSEGNEKSVAQVRKDGLLCPSVLELAEKCESIRILDGLSVLSHRIGILKAMLQNQEGGYVKATVAGLTNTLRFKHAKPLVNLPSVEKPYGAEIRGCLIAPEGYVLCGADMTSLEDTTKRHYMQPLDPEYVAEMSKPGFDPHLDLAKHAGVISQEDIDKHNTGERSLKALRKNYKVVNYSATYGVKEATLSRTTGMKKSEAKKLLAAFWDRNWSVEAVAKGVRVREPQGLGGMWLKNPVSGFWYSLRSEKDRFSTLNQGTGVYCFDTWVKHCRKDGVKTIGQFHDEIITLVKEGKETQEKISMEDSIERLNDELQLNVPLGTDVQFGNSYADIH